MKKLLLLILITKSALGAEDYEWFDLLNSDIQSENQPVQAPSETITLPAGTIITPAPVPHIYTGTGQGSPPSRTHAS